MKELSRITALYEKIDASLEVELQHTQDPKKLESIRSQQQLNDQAYFILAWGQLEQAINEKCRAVITKGRANQDWRKRRSWYLYNPNDKRLSGLSFEDRTALVFDKEVGRGSDFAKVKNYYDMRNQVAHGTVLSQRIDVVAVANDLWSLKSVIG